MLPYDPATGSRHRRNYRDHPILTEIIPASEFWQAEECHQRFYEKCGQGYCTSRKNWE